MPKQRPLKEPWVWILDYLRDEARGGYGWRRRGVRGWRLYEEIEQVVETKIPEHLPGLWRAGLVDRTRVEDPGRSAPLYLYRISQAGIRQLAEAEGESPPPIMEPLPEAEDPEKGSLFVPDKEWSALELLRRHAIEHRGPVRWEQHGWMTAREMAVELDRAVGEIIGWLRARNLVERRRGAHARGTQQPWFYRASERGLRAELVDAVPVLYEPPRLVQVSFRSAESGEPDSGPNP